MWKTIRNAGYERNLPVTEPVDEPVDSVENPQLRERARVSLAGLGLVGEDVRRKAWDAFKANPEGVERVAATARAGNNPTGLFLYLIENGAHLLPSDPKSLESGRPQAMSNASVDVECEVCGGDRFVPVDDGEEVKPCPACNAGVDTRTRSPVGRLPEHNEISWKQHLERAQAWLAEQDGER
jgi:hypothetical protein